MLSYVESLSHRHRSSGGSRDSASKRSLNDICNFECAPRLCCKERAALDFGVAGTPERGAAKPPEQVNPTTTLSE
jgi:hypothetical protein